MKSVFEAKQVVAHLQKNDFKAYLVGGCVRDSIMGRQPKDWDVATSATPEQVMKLFTNVLPTGIKHGTVTVRDFGLNIEVTTFRSEGDYTDGRRPDSVKFEQDITADLSRRDFTMNAIAYDPVADVFVDPFEGVWDIENKVIRAVGTAHARFSEDGLRSMRAIRFASTLGFFIEESTRSAIGYTRDTFRKVSAERIEAEFTKILLSPNPQEGIDLLRDTGLQQIMIPELQPWLFRKVVGIDKAPQRIEARLALLLKPIAIKSTVSSILTRMKYSGQVVEDVSVAVSRALPTTMGISDTSIRKWISSVGRERAQWMSFVCGNSEEEQREFDNRVAEVLASQAVFSTKHLALTGEDVMHVLQCKPGPIVKKALDALLDIVLESPSANTPTTLTFQLRLMQNIGTL